MKLWAIGIGLLGLTVYAQPPGAEPVSIPITPLFATATSAAPSTLNYVNVIVDASANGGDLIDVTASNPQLPVSLILPSGVEVTPINASSLGFSVYQQTNVSASGGNGFVLPFDTLGTHTAFTLPPGSVAGTYQVKLDSTGGDPKSASITLGPPAVRRLLLSRLLR